jgi:hypothetical protein
MKLASNMQKKTGFNRKNEKEEEIEEDGGVLNVKC